MGRLYDLTAEEIKYLDKLIEKTQESLSHAPKGTLNIDRSSGHAEYYMRLTGSEVKRVYIAKYNLALAKALAQKDYDKKLLKKLKERRTALARCASACPPWSPDSVYYGLSKERQSLVVPVVTTDVQFAQEWQDTPYTGKGFADDSGSYYTERGERVRSKSEVIIANLLYHMEIPYRYEFPLKTGEKILYPDFTVLDVKRRRIIFAEHFGMIDNPEYAKNFLWKINFYAVNGIIQGKNLITTFEGTDTQLDIRSFKEQLEYVLGL